MQFLKQDTVPLAKSLQYYSFGQVPCQSAEEFNGMQTLFKENIKIINNHLKGRTNMVGQQLTIVDVYLCLSQVELQQCVMDPNLKNSLNNLNGVFKTVTADAAFTKRMGAIKAGKKQILPVFAA